MPKTAQSGSTPHHTVPVLTQHPSQNVSSHLTRATDRIAALATVPSSLRRTARPPTTPCPASAPWDARPLIRKFTLLYGVTADMRQHFTDSSEAKYLAHIKQ